MNLEAKLKQLGDRLAPKQQTLDFTRTERWQHLPHTDQQACRQAIAQLLCEVMTPTQEKEDE